MAMLRTGLLAIIITIPATAGAAAPPIPPPSTTGPAVDGVALALVPNRRRFVEGRAIDGQFLSMHLYIRNVTKRRRVITVSDGPFYPDLELVDRRGARYTPTFLPPPMPRPGGPRRRKVTLAPGSWLGIGVVETFSGFNRVGQKGRLYPMLPAGRYKLRARAVSVAGVKGKLESDRPVIEVRRSDAPVNQLRLGLRARRPVVRSGKATQIEVVLSNVGKEPLRLDLERARLELAVRGPSVSYGRADHRPAPKDLRPAIKPGGRLRFALSFPGTVGERDFKLGGKGWYWLLLSLRCPAGASSKKQGQPWSGEALSRPLWIEVR
jgi:hypothetical protein